MNNKITIIEGPSPTFEPISGNNAHDEYLSWAESVLEGPYLYNTYMTAVRTFDSEKLVERCKTAWQARQPMFLEYKDEIGLRQEVSIIAARSVMVEEGDMLLMWVRREVTDEPEQDDFDFDSPDF